MQKPTTLTLDDIVFENRNQAYGAYLLRQLYQPTLARATGIGVGVFLLAVSAPTLYARFAGPDRNREVNIEVSLTNIPKTEPIKEKPLEIPEPEKLPTASTIKSLPPEVLPDEEVRAEDLPPTVEQLAEATPSDITQEGTGEETEIIAPPEETAAPTKTETLIEMAPREEEAFISVEQQPEFPGGMKALSEFLQRNLRYPSQAVQASVSGRVFISFVVNTDGSLTDVHVLKGIGFGCDEEARRVVQQMPRWKPGKQSGRTVRVKYNLPVTFTLE